MDTVDLSLIVREALQIEKSSLSKADHPHVAAAHHAAIKDLNERLDQIRRSNRLVDRISLQA
ncbi:MAG TPA: hypothetical protein VF491_02495 [Vicinamibacterales bacterium]